MDLRRGLVVLVTLVSLLAGCASYELMPAGITHPAHPEGQAAHRPPRSRTLAYTAVDIPSVQPTAATAAARQEPPPPASAAGAPAAPGASSQTVIGEGEVVSTVPGSGQIVVDHEEIKGFMEAMTMGYRVDPPSLLATVRPGDKVRFTIDVSRRAIVKIEKVP